MDLYTMRYVVAVAEYESFSLAAQACYVGQPALSQQISKLEAELGVALFNRNPRGVKLTEAGREFVHRAQEILQRAEALQAEMADYTGMRKGTLNLGVITSLQCINFGRLLSAFFNAYPNIAVNIDQGGTHQLLSRLSERVVDAALINRPMAALPAYLNFRKLGEDRYSLAVPAAHPLSGRQSVSLAELKDERFIFHQGGQVASELCFHACREAGFEPHIVCRSGSPVLGLYMVQGGLGVAFLPAEDFQYRPEGVVELKIVEPIIKEVGIAWRRDNNSPLVDAIVDFSGSWSG